MQQLAHPNIIKLYEVFETPNSVYMIQELVDGGELMQQITERGIFTEQDAISTIKTIIEVVAYIHSQNIMHRDLKPENILTKKDKNNIDIRVVDFGLATSNDVEEYLFRRCGTPGYAAPEILNGEVKEKYSLVCDMFSIGIIFYML